MICPYQPCGENENCVGCCNDPQKRSMTKEQFLDMNSHLGCGDCKHCTPFADLDGVESPCKRLDHKHYQFAIPWFKSYDCGQRGGCICADFEPNEWELWLYRHWQPEFLSCPSENSEIGLCIDKDQSVRYYVKAKDFFNNTFKNSDGSLKWVKKCYYKRDNSSPMKYKLVTERP